MKRRDCLRTTSLAAAGGFFSPLLFAAPDGKMGTIPIEEWQTLNEAAGEKLKELHPDTEPLSEGDQSLMKEIAAGGMRQLQLSQIAVKRAASGDVKAYAQAEVEEQAGLAAKLNEIARDKGMSLPSEPDEETGRAVERLAQRRGTDLDEEYLRQVGVSGHEALRAILERVDETAADPTLKLLATTALPLVQLHLKAAREELEGEKVSGAGIQNSGARIRNPEV